MSAKTVSTAMIVLLVWALAVGQLANTLSSAGSFLEASSTPTLVPRAYLPLLSRNWKQIKVGLVTDVGGVNDQNFNTAAWKGVQKAIDELGAYGTYLESRQPNDYTRNMNQFVNQGYDLIITVGFLMSVDTANVARANPGTRFAIVDHTYPDCWSGAVPGRDCGSDTVIPNVSGLTFSPDQAAFLAGYLAAGMTTTGKVATFGGIRIPPVTVYMVGFEQGTKYYNQQHGTNVKVLGWTTDPARPGCGEGLFTGTFGDTGVGYSLANSLLDQGADVIFPVAGSTGLGAAQACHERGKMHIGVDTDWYVSVPEYRQAYLTSVLKNIDVAVFDTIRSVLNGTFRGSTYTGVVANGGVGLAPYHEYEDDVPVSLRAKLEQVRQGIANGNINTWPCP